MSTPSFVLKPIPGLDFFTSAPNMLEIAVTGTDRSYTLKTRMLDADEFEVGEQLLIFVDRVASVWSVALWLGDAERFQNDYHNFKQLLDKTEQGKRLQVVPLTVLAYDSVKHAVTARLGDSDVIWVVRTTADRSLDIQTNK